MQHLQTSETSAIEQGGISGTPPKPQSQGEKKEKRKRKKREEERRNTL